VSRNTDVTHVLEVHLSTNYWKRSNCPIEPFARLSNCSSELAVMSTTARFSARPLFKPVLTASLLCRHSARIEQQGLTLRLAGTRCFIPIAARKSVAISGAAPSAANRVAVQPNAELAG
jgi:hypothetical protein